MKINKPKLYILAVPLLGVSVALFFLPDSIPLQWGFDGSVNRYGSKYFLLLLALLPYVIYLRSRSRRK